MSTIKLFSRYNSAVSRSEVNTFLTFAVPPHLPLALAALLFILSTVYRQRQTKSRVSPGRFVLSYVLPTLLNPFSLPTPSYPLAVVLIGYGFLGLLATTGAVRQ